MGMTRPVRLDTSTPMASLLALCDEAGVSRAEVARRAGVKPPSLHGFEDAGERVQVSSLAKVADALGYRLRLSVEKK